ncbi:DNA (cytosine-5-)-methyltransferase [Agrobacterium pusense]|uniref:DNA cytosine methyltransferase n=1 Tax=Agrobacterium pusense TaxID=648995 RepID=UPI0010BF57FF|nr:DNA (cytosine-5-)-methyltransferase [Agrobacterium pusense]QCL83890.1 DNA (cytosine-5-)-methyltransferase [Agrobacterium pusense]
MNVLDLFSGIGGFSLGLERAGFDTVAFCEINPFCRAVLKKHWPDVPCFDDIRALSAETLSANGVGAVDLICGGFPCQDISPAGSGRGLEGDRSGLWFEFRRLVEEVSPNWGIIENSSRLRSLGLEIILGQLDALGYDAEWHCIPASAVGAPHQRDRLWVIAHSQRLGLSGQGQLVTSINPTPQAYREANRLINAFRRRCLPFVCGGHDGLPTCVDEPSVNASGNAVVPPIPEMLGKAIKQRLAA